jgi:hypothetical protein
MQTPLLALLQLDDTGPGIFVVFLWLAIAIVVIAGVWKMFVKAGKPGWGAIIPIYNIILILEITGRPLWWLILCLIPLVNIVVWIIVAIDLAKAFGKGTGFGIGIAFLGCIFLPILGFGDAQYRSSTVPA